MEMENNEYINFLDLFVRKQNRSFTYKIYRKPTTTDLTIHAHSYHPYTQKIAPFNAFVHRLLNVPLSREDYRDEVNIIKYIAVKNGYKSNMIDNLIRKHRYKQNKMKTDKDKVQFVSAEYTNVLPNVIKNEFKKLNINVSFRTCLLYTSRCV